MEGKIKNLAITMYRCIISKWEEDPGMGLFGKDKRGDWYEFIQDI